MPVTRSGIYYEEHGTGRPIVVLHGGPGVGLSRSVLSLFDLRKWHVILYDQRGAGKSALFDSSNRSHLVRTHVQDLEELRRAVIGPETPWTLFGGSWGTFLALAYWRAFPSAAVVAGMVLRGVCLLSDAEQRWVYENEKDSAAALFPQEWRKFSRTSGRETFRALTRRYRKRLLSATRNRKRAAAAWCAWEDRLSFATTPTPASLCSRIADQETAHFLQIRDKDSAAVLAAARRIPPSVPVWIIHGEFDMVCPLSLGAQKLHAAIPHSRLIVVEGAPHNAQRMISTTRNSSTEATAEAP